MVINLKTRITDFKTLTEASFFLIEYSSARLLFVSKVYKGLL